MSKAIQPKVIIRKRYDPSLKVAIAFTKPSKTKQAFKDESDINNILAKYQKTGVLTHVANKPPGYGDFSNVEDYQTSLNKVLEAQRGFMDLPSSIRARFNNDPGAFLEFTSNPANMGEMVKMGLATAKPTPQQDLPIPETPSKAPESGKT